MSKSIRNSTGKFQSQKNLKRSADIIEQTVPSQQADDDASMEEQESVFSGLQSNDDDESDDEISLKIREAEERIKLLSAHKKILDRKVAAKLRLEELENQQKSLELSIADANGRLSVNNSREIANSDFSLSQAQTDDLRINRSLWDSSSVVTAPINTVVTTSPVITTSVITAPVITGTTFVNDDGVVFISMNKKTAAMRIKKNAYHSVEPWIPKGRNCFWGMSTWILIFKQSRINSSDLPIEPPQT